MKIIVKVNYYQRTTPDTAATDVPRYIETRYEEWDWE